MKEKNIDLPDRRPKGLSDLPPVEIDYSITMGCEETCPAVPARKIIEWQIPDPKGKSIDEVRRIRDMVEANRSIPESFRSRICATRKKGSLDGIGQTECTQNLQI